MLNHHTASLPALARMFLKAQTELNSLLDSLPLPARASSHPFLNLELGSTRMAMGLNMQSSSDLQLSCSQGPLEYHLNLVAGKPNSAPTAQARLVNRRTGEKVTLDGESVFRGEVPEEFKALHQEVTHYLKSWLPASLWTTLSTSSAAPALDTASNTTTGTASNTAPDAPTAQSSEPAVNPAMSSSAGSASDEAKTAPAAAHEPVYEVFVLNQKDGPDLRFMGKLLDSVRTPVYHGRWTELHAYQTKAGKFVGVKLGRSLLFNESDRAESKVTESLAELSGFFGHSPLAKALTERLGIREYVEIE